MESVQGDEIPLLPEPLREEDSNEEVWLPEEQDVNTNDVNDVNADEQTVHIYPESEDVNEVDYTFDTKERVHVSETDPSEEMWLDQEQPVANGSRYSDDFDKPFNPYDWEVHDENDSQVPQVVHESSRDLIDLDDFPDEVNPSSSKFESPRHFHQSPELNEDAGDLNTEDKAQGVLHVL